ncbi:MAG: cob(I)yrinic acid a,c-diamide adenosyltransferase [bacterium]|nr:cob(I)yrinic acid a,c-diamide adenosyltransferase [bacterium]
MTDKKLKIYTKKGDMGETSLIFGERVSKDHPRVNSYGTIDELNASLGLATSFTKNRRLTHILQEIQNELFNIGAELASPRQLKKNTKEYYSLQEAKIPKLEKIIDLYDEKLPTLQTFILPTGVTGAVALHAARTICRRAERAVVAIAKVEKINPNIIAYLNRLSDLLFVLARYLSKQSGSKEIHWKKD